VRRSNHAKNSTRSIVPVDYSPSVSHFILDFYHGLLGFYSKPIRVTEFSFIDMIDKIEVNKSGAVRRAKLYYIRELKGKAMRIKEKRSANS